MSISLLHADYPFYPPAKLGVMGELLLPARRQAAARPALARAHHIAFGWATAAWS